VNVQEKFFRRMSLRPRRSDRRILLYALLIAIGAHVLFLCWSNYSYRKPVRTLQENHASITLLSGVNFSGRELKVFRSWMGRHDPTRFNRSDFSGGFAAQLPAESRCMDISDRRPRTRLSQDTPHIRSFKPVDESDFSPRVVLPAPASVSAPLPKRRSGAVIVDDRGRAVRLPGVKLPFRSPAVRGDTVLRVLNSGRLPTLALESGCGDPELDRIARNALIGNASDLPPDMLYLIVRWPEPPQGKESGK